MMDELALQLYYCCVHGCNSKLSYRTFNIFKLHDFPPRDSTVDGENLFYKWINNIKLPAKYTNKMRVCSLHFTDDDFLPGPGHKLKEAAFPTQKLPRLWRNKFYPRNYGKMIKFLEYRGIGRLRLCLQAKLVKRLKQKTVAINEQKRKDMEIIQKAKEEGLKVAKAFSLSREGPMGMEVANELHSEIQIKEEPLSDQEDMGQSNENMDDNDDGNDSVEEMLARMNEDDAPMPALNNNIVIVNENEPPDDDCCPKCGSDACTGHKGMQFECCYCNKSFNSSGALSLHNLSHYERTAEGKLRCKVCAEAVTDMRVTEHMSMHGGEGSQVCMLCDKAFGTTASLMMHVNSEHTLERAERCRLCRVTRPTREALDEHVREHRVLRKEYVCRACGDTFRTKDACWSHLNHHARRGFRPGFECDLCGRILSTRATLREHMFIHSGEKPFECLLCGKKIRHRANFIIHVQSHSLVGGGAHSCQTCGASFSRKSDLNNHVSTSHPQDMPYNCIICGLRFKTEVRFLKHATTHDASLEEEP